MNRLVEPLAPAIGAVGDPRGTDEVEKTDSAKPPRRGLRRPPPLDGLNTLTCSIDMASLYAAVSLSTIFSPSATKNLVAQPKHVHVEAVHTAAGHNPQHGDWKHLYRSRDAAAKKKLG